ncbi:Bacteriophage Mu Gam like protein [Thalassoglobus neptunius]|uniref:Bacteriophage Mu Gam like protein n=1 Tax=Thalassoglobus neptunius TaxID=1938619 RepID=A0A5C5VYL8_9PLAN|nr:host-nuclease inhibitor Gam family protein [Thalassoglobus neptunius]TWT43053.1 Bacteriophage Mu Gam like protein [Thalassoglobus neptunius]
METPSVQSREDLAHALELLQSHRLQHDQIQNEIETELSALRQKLEQRLTIRVGRRRVSIAEYIAELETAIETYVLAEAETLFAQQKTLQWPHGKISARAASDKLEFDRKATIGKIRDRFGLNASLETIFDQNPELRSLIEFDIKPSQSKMLTALKSGLLKRNRLKQLGINVVTPEHDSITIKTD